MSKRTRPTNDTPEMAFVRLLVEKGNAVVAKLSISDIEQMSAMFSLKIMKIMGVLDPTGFASRQQVFQGLEAACAKYSQDDKSRYEVLVKELIDELRESASNLSGVQVMQFLMQLLVELAKPVRTMQVTCLGMVAQYVVYELFPELKQPKRMM